MPTEIIAPTAAVLLLDNNTVLFNTVLNTDVLLLDNNTANNRLHCVDALRPTEPIRASGVHASGDNRVTLL